MLCLRWWRSCEDAGLEACGWAEFAFSCGANCMAGACLTETKSTNVEASKRNRTILFTTILLREISREFIQSQVGEKVSGNCVPDVLGINQPSFCGQRRLVLL
jgi:hypothetical protein